MVISYNKKFQIPVCRYAILDAVTVICQRGVNGVNVCDSKPGVQSLSSVQPTHYTVVHQILSFLSLVCHRNLIIKFVWVPSHVDLNYNDTVDRFAREAYHLPHRGAVCPLSLYGAAGLQRGHTALPSPTTSLFASTNTRTVGRASWFGGTTLFLPVCGWATGHRGRLPGWKANLPS